MFGQQCRHLVGVQLPQHRRVLDIGDEHHQPFDMGFQVLQQGRVLPENAVLQVLELRRGVDPQLFDQHVPGPLIGSQGVRLATCPVQREHLLGPESFPQRMLGGQHLQFCHQLGMGSDRQIGGDPVLDGSHPQLLQPGSARRAGWSIKSAYGRPRHRASASRSSSPVLPGRDSSSRLASPTRSSNRTASIVSPGTSSAYPVPRVTMLPPKADRSWEM